MEKIDAAENARGSGLRVCSLSAGFKKRTVISGIDLSVRKAEILVLAGPNGAGKTTLLKCVAGLVKPFSGAVHIEGKDLAGMDKREKARRIAFLAQQSSLPWPFTVRELVGQGRFSSGGMFFSKESSGGVEEAVSLAGLSGFEERPVTELSGGEYQRVLIARAIAQGSPWLVLDEPVNNLDPAHQIMVMELCLSLCAQGRGIIMSLHDLALARHYAGRIALLFNGRIHALGSPGEALTDELIQEVFGLSAEGQRIIGTGVNV